VTSRTPVTAIIDGRPVRLGKRPTGLWLIFPILNYPWIGLWVAGRSTRQRRWSNFGTLYFLAQTAVLIVIVAVGGYFATAAAACLSVIWPLGIVQCSLYQARWRKLYNTSVGSGSEPPVYGYPQVLPRETAQTLTPPVTNQSRPMSGVDLAAVLAQSVERAKTGPTMPAEALGQVQNIAELLAPVIREGHSGALAAEQETALSAMLTDYMPQTLDRFLRLPDTYLNIGDNRATATLELSQQLGYLVDGATRLQLAVFGAEADRFAANGRFLEGKFRKSGLDL
jgi:hypothetical protein